MGALRRLRKAKYLWYDLFAAGVFLFLFAPVIIIVLFSFHESPRLSFPISGLSLRWYGEVLGSAVFRSAVKNTLIVATATSSTAVVLGTLASLGMTRNRSRLARWVLPLLMVPISLPALFLGIALLSYFSMLRFQLSLLTVTIGHLIYTLPYFVLVANARLERFDMVVEEAARDLGATPWQVLWRVTLPIIAPSIIGAGIVVFALSFEFLITFFVIGSQSTLPMLIWSMMRRTIDPSINAISSVLLLMSLLLVIITSRLVRVTEISL
jgi:ABC-type spermidine/putrescine transport system permease subunit II